MTKEDCKKESLNILIHGYNVKDPMETIGKLKPHLDNVVMFNYGWFGLASVLLYNKREAQKLKLLLDANPNATVIAHSNGCAITVAAAKMGAKMDNLICINPALKVNTKVPESIKRIAVIHTEHDTPTKAARFFDKIPFIQLIIPNAWGAMGAKGAKDKRAVNFDFTEFLSGHSEFFKFSKISQLLPVIKQWIKSINA